MGGTTYRCPVREPPTLFRVPGSRYGRHRVGAVSACSASMAGPSTLCSCLARWPNRHSKQGTEGGIWEILASSIVFLGLRVGSRARGKIGEPVIECHTTFRSFRSRHWKEASASQKKQLGLADPIAAVGQLSAFVLGLLTSCSCSAKARETRSL